MIIYPELASEYKPIILPKQQGWIKSVKVELSLETEPVIRIPQSRPAIHHLITVGESPRDIVIISDACLLKLPYERKVN